LLSSSLDDFGSLPFVAVAVASLQFCCCELLLKKNYYVDKLKADRLVGMVSRRGKGKRKRLSGP